MYAAYLINVEWNNASDDNLVNEFATRCIENLDKAAKAAGLYYPFVYLNDALGSQKNVFSLYGGGRSLPKLQSIAKSYGASWPLVFNGFFLLVLEKGRSALSVHFWLILTVSTDEWLTGLRHIDAKGVFQRLMPGGFKLFAG